MHQQVDKPDEREQLIQQKYKLVGEYRNAVRWACTALDYKRRFEREEDFHGLQDYIDILREDSRQELIRVATNIKVLRKRIVEIEEKLMNLSKRKNE